MRDSSVNLYCCLCSSCWTLSCCRSYKPCCSRYSCIGDSSYILLCQPTPAPRKCQIWTDDRTHDTLHHLLLLSQETGHLLQATGQRDNIQPGLRSHSPSLDQVAQYLHNINISVQEAKIILLLLVIISAGWSGWSWLVCGDQWGTCLRISRALVQSVELPDIMRKCCHWGINHHSHTWCQYPRILVFVPAYTWCSSWQRWLAPRCSKT